MKKLNIFASKRKSGDLSSSGQLSPSAPTDTLHRIVSAKEEVIESPAAADKRSSV